MSVDETENREMMMRMEENEWKTILIDETLHPAPRSLNEKELGI